MKAAAAPSLHEKLELQQVPLTRTRQKNLQAPVDVVSRQLSQVARAKIFHACANLDACAIILMRAMQVMVDLVIDRTASEAASILEQEGKKTLTINEISTGTRLALLDSKDRENACHPLLDLNLVRFPTLKYTQYMS